MVFPIYKQETVSAIGRGGYLYADMHALHPTRRRATFLADCFFLTFLSVRVVL